MLIGWRSYFCITLIFFSAYSFSQVQPFQRLGTMYPASCIGNTNCNQTTLNELDAWCSANGGTKIYPPSIYTSIAGAPYDHLVCFIPRLPNYSLADVNDSPPPSLCPNPSDAVGNPIESGSGAKYQKDVDLAPRSNGQVSFTRTYRNRQLIDEPLWHNNYDIKLTIVDPKLTSLVKKISNPYGSQSGACVSGWNEIKSSIVGGWAIGATANFKDGKCRIVNGSGNVVKILPIIPADPADLYVTPGAVQIRQDDGSTVSFQFYDLSSLWVPINGDQGILERLNEYKIGWRYKLKNGTIQDFSRDGKLLSITSVNGVKQELTYDPSSGQLVKVQDSFGKSLRFSYANMLLSAVTSDDNKTISYTYNSGGLLVDVKYSDDTHRLYHYEDARFPNYLTGVTDQRGVRFATWSYDALGRAISSEHAGGVDKTTLTFNADGSTTILNALNKNTVYKFIDSVGVRRVSSVEGQPTANCTGANKNYTYTEDGWLASKTDWKGIKTTYQYNTKGQEVSRTEAESTTVAKVITTEWHPTLNLRTKVTEPDKETNYSYDANGVITKQSVKSTKAQ